MGDHIIDCCSLLNLYTGWAGLNELIELKKDWLICDAVVNETEYTREFTKEGAFVKSILDLKPPLQAGLLRVVRSETDAELQDYVNFALEIDDGEAQALAIAKNRGYVLLTDDRRAIKLAGRIDIAVQTTSTITILQQWAKLRPENEARLYEVIRRISVLARFSPRSRSADYDWWEKYCK
jgi:predicted nucleic acid-binding protein